MTAPDWAALSDLGDELIGAREEDVKFKVVEPMLSLLGYSRLECFFETPADLGRIDISVEGFPVGVVVECKRPNASLEDFIPQIERYVRDTMTRHHAAMVAILTNGNRFVIYGVLGPIHKGELADHKLFDFWRHQLKQPDTQEKLLALLGRNVVGGPAEDARNAIEAALSSWRESTQQRANLRDEREQLEARIRAIDDKLGGPGYPRSGQVPPRPSMSSGRKGGIKWKEEYGSQETVFPWIRDVLDRLVPPGSREFVAHDKLTRELCETLANRGSDRAKSQTREERLDTAGNMIDWVTARWTHFLGGKGSSQMMSDPGASVDAQDAPLWLREFTTRWTRKRAGKWSFGRR